MTTGRTGTSCYRTHTTHAMLLKLTTTVLVTSCYRTHTTHAMLLKLTILLY